MNLVILGVGYVGLVSGACFAEFGWRVVCIDKDRDKIDLLKRGRLPFYEPGLDALVKKNWSSGHLAFSTDLEREMEEVDIIFITVGTPNHRGDPDLHQIFSAVEEIGRYIRNPTTIVTKSTTPVGTTRRIKHSLEESRPEIRFEICANPEFLRQGSAIEDFMRPDRIIVGVESREARELLRRVYYPLEEGGVPIVFTSLEDAELIKYASNSFLATKIAFINEISDLCERVGGDIRDVAYGMGLDRRINHQFLQAGPGYGGSCFPKDTEALAKTARSHQMALRIVETVIDVNQERMNKMVNKILDVMGDVRDKRITILGVTFKSGTDDLRGSAALTIIPALQRAGAIIHAYDPVGMTNAQSLFSEVLWFETAYQAVDQADGVVILTEWDEFQSLDLTFIASALRRPIIVDLRNIYVSYDLRHTGLIYHSVGVSEIKRTRWSGF